MNEFGGNSIDSLPETGTDFWLRNVSKTSRHGGKKSPTKKSPNLEVCFKWKKDGGFSPKDERKYLGFFGAEKPPHPPTPRLESQFRTAARDPGEIEFFWLPRIELGRDFFWGSSANMFHFHPYLEKMNPFRLIFFGWVES